MKKFDPRTLPYMGAIAQAAMFGLAGYKYFSLGIPGGIGGACVGAIVNLSMASAASRVSDVAKSRKFLSYLSLIGLFCVSPAVIVSSLGWSWATFFWSVSVDLSILLTGAVAGKSLMAQEQPPKPATETPKLPRNRKKVAEKRLQKPVTDDELLSFFAGNPGATNTDAAQHFGVTRQAIGKRVKKLYEVKQ